MLCEIEKQRLEALRVFGILDTPPEEGFERLTALAASIFDAPIALVSFVDDERQWFKSVRGIDVPQTPRAHAFCAHTIMDDSPMVIEDAWADSRFSENPLVTGEPHIRFYAGAPIITEEGHRLGAICVIDRQPRKISPSDSRILQHLAACVMSELKLRRSVCSERAARDAAENALRERRRFVSTISHEMRTPLNAILGYGALLEGAQLSVEDETYLQAVKRSSADLAQLLYDLFDKYHSVAPEVEPAGQVIRRHFPANSDPLEILIVDDVPANLALMKAYATRLGHKPTLASSGEEAINLARCNHYDLILMDIQMPALNGVAAARRIISESLGSAPPVIAVTCDTSPENRQDCVDAGFAGFLEKPVSLSRLADTLADLPARQQAGTA